MDAANIEVHAPNRRIFTPAREYEPAIFQLLFSLRRPFARFLRAAPGTDGVDNQLGFLVGLVIALFETSNKLSYPSSLFVQGDNGIFHLIDA